MRRDAIQFNSIQLESTSLGLLFCSRSQPSFRRRVHSRTYRKNLLTRSSVGLQLSWQQLSMNLAAPTLSITPSAFCTSEERNSEKQQAWGARTWDYEDFSGWGNTGVRLVATLFSVRAAGNNTPLLERNRLPL